jgi:predicted dehydrogenase
MKKIKVAVVGVGSLGQYHARKYAEMLEADLLAVVDCEENQARKVAELCGCRALTRYEDLGRDIDAVSVVTPTHLHAEVGEFFLRRGVHVLVEKPICSSLAEADSLIEAAEKSGAVLHVGHSERFNPALRSVRPFITTPQFFEAHRLGVFVPRSLDVDVVLDLMIHDLDMILHLTRSEVKEIHAVGIPVLTPRIDIANARLEFLNGCVANVTASRVSKEKIRKLRFFQPNDYISIDFHQQSVEMYSLMKDALQPKICERSPTIDRGEPLRIELAAFLSVIQGREEPNACTGRQARKSLSLALDILQRMAAH